MSVHKHEPGTPMPHTHAPHLLNPLRSIILSPRTLVRRLELKPHFRVLELGPGPGYFSPTVAHAVPEGKLVLVDVQTEMLNMARKRLEKQAISNVEYHQANALSLPLEEASFDVAFLVAVLGEVSDRAGCFKELHRVLRPGGLLSVTEMKIFDPDAIPLSVLQDSVEAAGFQRESCHKRLFHFTAGFCKLT